MKERINLSLTGRLRILLTLCALSAPPAEAQSLDSLAVYVWSFSTRDGLTNDLTIDLTKEFEEKLIQCQHFKVLERRQYGRLLAQKDNERAILKIDGISSTTLNSLKTIQAGAVFFGEVHHDVDLGLIKVTATCQAFDGSILFQQSTDFPAWQRLNAAKRDTAMQKLVNKFTTRSGKSTNSEKPPIPLSEAALILASAEGKIETVRLLVNTGVNKDARDSDRNTPLMWAARQGHRDIVQFLIKSNATINAQNKNGTTALFSAATYGHLGIVQDLVNAGIDINLMSNDSSTAIFGAVINGNTEIVRYLLEKGANPNTQFKGMTAVQMASFKGYEEIVQLLKKYNGTTTLPISPVPEGQFSVRLQTNSSDDELQIKEVKFAILQEGYDPLHQAARDQGLSPDVRPAMEHFPLRMFFGYAFIPFSNIERIECIHEEGITKFNASVKLRDGTIAKGTLSFNGLFGSSANERLLGQSSIGKREVSLWSIKSIVFDSWKTVSNTFEQPVCSSEPSPSFKAVSDENLESDFEVFCFGGFSYRFNRLVEFPLDPNDVFYPDFGKISSVTFESYPPEKGELFPDVFVLLEGEEGKTKRKVRAGGTSPNKGRLIAYSKRLGWLILDTTGSSWSVYRKLVIDRL